MGYGTSCREGADFDHTVAEVRAGVNVIIWFATNLAAGKDGQPQVTSGQNHTCVALMVPPPPRRRCSCALSPRPTARG